MDFGLTTLMGWGFVVILRLLTETPWGLALGVEVDLVVQAHPDSSHSAKDNLLRRYSFSCLGIRMDLGKL